jgi:hypothetical protein
MRTNITALLMITLATLCAVAQDWVKINVADLSVSRSDTVTGTQSVTIATALQPPATNGFVNASGVTNIAAGLIDAIPAPPDPVVTRWHSTPTNWLVWSASEIIEYRVDSVWNWYLVCPTDLLYPDSGLLLSAGVYLSDMPYPIENGSWQFAGTAFDGFLDVLSVQSIYGLYETGYETEITPNFSGGYSGTAYVRYLPTPVTNLVSTKQYQTSDQVAAAVNAATGALASAMTASYVWQAYTNRTGSVTLTNDLERPVRLSGTGVVSVTFSGLREAAPLLLAAGGFDALTFSGCYVVGSGTWQTNMTSLFTVMAYGTNTLVSPITAVEDF